jgi:AcrR family transcriptional regulator
MGRKKLLANRADLILDAASELFSAMSYEKTTLDEIAERAGISKGSIYLEFESKEEILFTLIARTKDEQLHAMRRIANRKSESVLDLLKTMLVQNTGMIYDTVTCTRLSPEEMVQKRERIGTRLKPFLEARLALIEELLRRAENTREIRPLKEPRRTAQLIVMALRAVLPPYETDAGKVRIQHETAEILELIMNGLR